METHILPLEYHEISEAIRQKAEEELNETPETRRDCLKEMKKRILCEKNLTANMSDAFLLQFLRVKKFDTDRAFSTLKNYYTHRLCYKSMYRKYTPKQHLKVMAANMMNFLPWRSSEGCALWVSRCGFWEPQISDFEDILRLGLMCHEKALENPVTQICGVISIVDLKKFSWSHLFHISPTFIKCFVSASQSCFPIRHKAIHVVNNSSLFAVLFAMIKPLLNKLIRNRIYFHGEDFSSLHQFISPELLPEEFGGTKGKFENQQFYDLLLDSEDEFLHNNKFGYKDDKNCL